MASPPPPVCACTCRLLRMRCAEVLLGMTLVPRCSAQRMSTCGCWVQGATIWFGSCQEPRGGARAGQDGAEQGKVRQGGAKGGCGVEDPMGCLCSCLGCISPRRLRACTLTGRGRGRAPQPQAAPTAPQAAGPWPAARAFATEKQAHFPPASHACATNMLLNHC